MQWATMSSGRVRLNEPRNDFARGVRRLSTTTASRATGRAPICQRSIVCQRSIDRKCYAGRRAALARSRFQETAAKRDALSITEKKLMSEPSAERGTIDGVLRAFRSVLGLDLLGEHADCRPVDRPGFSGAFVARVETPSGAFCLRGWSQGAVGERILALHEFLAHVRSRGVDYVAVPFAAEHGETLVEVAWRLWQVEPWLPGSADFWSRPSDARLAAALGALAQFSSSVPRIRAGRS